MAENLLNLLTFAFAFIFIYTLFSLSNMHIIMSVCIYNRLKSAGIVLVKQKTKLLMWIHRFQSNLYIWNFLLRKKTNKEPIVWNEFIALNSNGKVGENESDAQQNPKP